MTQTKNILNVSFEKTPEQASAGHAIERSIGSTGQVQFYSRTIEDMLKAIESGKCDLAIVSTVQKCPMATIVAGYAHFKKIPTIYFCPGLRGPVNLMLSATARAVATDIETLTRHLKSFSADSDYAEQYLGLIE